MTLNSIGATAPRSNTPSLSRRHLASTGAALLTLAAGPAAATAPTVEPDAELIRLCRQIDALDDYLDAHPCDHPPGSDAEKLNDQLTEAVRQQQEALCDRVCAGPLASTPAGLAALAITVGRFQDRVMGVNDDTGLLARLLDSVTGGEDASAPTEPVSDAGLLALCAEYIALDRRFIAIGDEQDGLMSCDPVWKALNRKTGAMVPELHRLEREISAMPARTPEGIRAKAKATRHMLAAEGDTATEPMNDEAMMAWSLTSDLLQVGV